MRAKKKSAKRRRYIIHLQPLMKIRTLIILSLFTLAFFICMFAVFRDADSPLGRIGSVEIEGTTLAAKTPDARIELTFVSDNCLNVHVVQRGRRSPSTQVTEGRTPGSVPFAGKISGDPIVIRSKNLEARLYRKNCRIEVSDNTGKTVLSEIFTEKLSQKVFRFRYPEGSAMYGIRGYEAGAPSAEGMLRSGSMTITAGKQGNCAAPLIWSNEGFAFLADTDGGRINAHGGEMTLRDTSRDDLEYFVIAGNPFDIMKCVQRLTGKSPMFPKWSSGFINSEWGIDQKELLSLVGTYRKKKIPLDAFILDFDWKAWGDDRYGEWRWNEENFPDGKSGKLAALLRSKGVTLGGVFKPRIHVDTEQGRYAQSKNFFWPGKKPYNDYFSGDKVNDLDFSVPECRTWFWEKLLPAYDSGIRAFWNDEADEGFDNKEFMNMQRAFYDGQRSRDNNRVWSLNRNFYLGAQRYAYALWSGDIQSDFAAMKAQRERMLSAVNLGMMRWSMDTGGFNGVPSPENYARWMQFAAFCPVFRVHGSMDQQRQPWYYGRAENAAADAIRLRYSLLPYIYSYEKQYRDSGVYLVRPLLGENQRNPDLKNYVDGWFFGEYLAVYPVVDKGAIEKEVYIPDGEWIEYATGRLFTPGRHTVRCDSTGWSDIPLFIKRGAIIPFTEPMNFTDERPIETLYVDIFPARTEHSFNYYDDDGKSYDYEKGRYFQQTISARKEGKGARVRLSAKEGSFAPALRHYILKVYLCRGKVKGFASVPSIGALKTSREGYCEASDRRGSFIAVKVAAGQKRDISIAQ